MNKTTDFEAILLAYCPHMIVVTETWLSPDISSTDIVPPNYKSVRKDRGSQGGAVAIILENNLQCVILESGLHETLWCKIFL